MHKKLSRQIGFVRISMNTWTQVLQKLEPGRKVERYLVALLLLIFLAEGALTLCHMSATGDETHYLGMGRYLLKQQRWDLDDALLQPPLSYYLHSIPLLALPVNDRQFEIADMNARGRAIMATYADDRILMLARVPILLLAAGLGLLVYFWGKQAYGGTGGLLALVGYVFNPVVIANSAQITPDLCLTAFSTLTIYLFWRYRNSPSFLASAMTGGALGLALLSKYSAVLLVVALLVLTLMFSLGRRFGKESLACSWRVWHLAIIFSAALLVVNAGYFFKGSFRPIAGNAFHSTLLKETARIPLIRSIPVPLPHAFVLGMDLQHSVVENGFLSYLLGQKAEKGWVHFYLVAFLLKTPAAFLLLVIFVAVKGRDRMQWILWVPAILFPFYFSVFRLSRGIRYILPIYPLLCVWVGQIALRVRNRELRPVLQWSLLVLLVWYAAAGLWIAPHSLAYISEFGGGPGNGANLLFESDFDWGQEMKGLNAYLKQKKIDRVKLAYFSTADPAHYGIKFDPLPCETPPKPESGTIAASATVLQVWGCYDWLKKYQPVDKVGYTIFIYNIP
jgi:hypothetical protein